MPSVSPRYVWGVDVAVSRIAFGFARLPDGPVECETLDLSTDLREGERLAWIAEQTVAFACEHTSVTLDYAPEVVWVEQPTGSYPKPQLMYVTGIVQAALCRELGAPVWTIPVSTWKKNALGYGNASKQQVTAWVEQQGWHASTQDECDAAAIAAAGRAMLLAGEWEARAA